MEYGFHFECGPVCHLASSDYCHRLDFRLDAWYAKRQDYVLMAEAKGLKQRRIMSMYAARNAILPNITAFALSLGFVVSGSLLTEIVFSYPGIGLATLQAVDNHDYALLQGAFLVISVAVLAANFLADFVYILLDPRVRLGGN